MRFNCFICIVFIFLSCSKKEDFTSIKIIGHAGNGLNISNSMYHDNSKKSIELALSQNGCDGVEIDVQLSKDGTAWLFHDECLKEDTGLDACINSISDNEILDLSYKHFNNEKLLHLNKLVVKGKTLFLDLKHYNYCKNEVVDLNQVIKELNLFRSINSSCKIYIITNYKNWIKPLKQENFEMCFAPSLNENLDILISDYGVNSLIFKNKEISNQKMNYLRSKNIKITIFEVRSPKGIRNALNKHPDYLISDDVKATIVEKY
jgi:glycerophosphoryl diester phosphodiesterase